jgi:hypothetical protein
MTLLRAAADFAVIRARMRELRREKNPRPLLLMMLRQSGPEWTNCGGSAPRQSRCACGPQAPLEQFG